MFKINNKFIALIVNFKKYFTPFPSVSIADFEQVKVSRVIILLRHSKGA